MPAQAGQRALRLNNNEPGAAVKGCVEGNLRKGAEGHSWVAALPSPVQRGVEQCPSQSRPGGSRVDGELLQMGKPSGLLDPGEPRYRVACDQDLQGGSQLSGRGRGMSIVCPDIRM